MSIQLSKTVKMETATKNLSTAEFIVWLQSQDDDTKLRFAINWRIPHSIFNVACKFHDPDTIQGIDWYHIYKNKSELFTWSHGGAMY